ncbi:MAG: gliding motility-associated C-terminal domain-containing protein [Chitinophagaceae bacterium]|nr:gliding motility-associated C-terminal domain-containing protein [Chitinophagaceae bacterium]
MIAAPNAFTPNGDGLNDFFFPHLLNVNSFEMRIFNRWGKVIYSVSDQLSGWNEANGIDAEIGIYAII